MNLFNLNKKKENREGKKRHLIFTRFFEHSAKKYNNESRLESIVTISLQYLLAILLSIASTYFIFYFKTYLGQSILVIFLFTSVLISGIIGGLGPAILTTFLCALGMFYLFMPSYLPFNILNTYASQLIAFIIEGVFAGLILEARLKNNRSLRSRVQEQAVIAQLGQYALATNNLTLLFNKTLSLISETLGIKYCKILELLPGKKSLLLKAGMGWQPGLVGHSIISISPNSQPAFALNSIEPVIIRDLKKEKRFYPLEILISHGIVSSLNVVIPGKRGPYGILGIDSIKRRNFTHDDLYFIQAIANILATAIEKKSSEQDLRDSEIKFKKLFDSNIVGAFISDFNGTFLEANDALLNLIGYTREDLKTGIVQRDQLTAANYEYLSEKAVHDLKTKGKSDIYEKEYITKSGNKIPVLIAVSRIDAKNNTCVGFVLDISKQKEIEKRKDEFISIASHELKTPVTTLKILTQFLKQKAKVKNESEQLKYLDKMDNQVDKLTDLISDLLDLTKIQAGKLELHKKIFNLNDLVKEISEDIQALTTTHKIVVKADLKDAVLGDRDRIGQVITNLLTNAVKYSPKGSDIILKSENKDGFARVSVTDFGAGIDKEYQKSIFEQFFRVHNDATYPGLGMGLFISNQIIQRHDGKIWVESEKNKGSTFYFTIPIPTNIYE